MIRRRIEIATGIIRAFKNWPTMLRLLRTEGIGVRRVRTRDGLSFDLRETRWDALILRETFVDEPYSGFDLPATPVVVDIGAFIGDFTLFAAHRWGAEVHAYEPIKEYHDRLVEHAALNGLSDRIHPHFAAVASTPGTLDLHIHHEGPARHIHASTAWYEGGEHRTVPAVSLLDVLNQHDRIDLLKVDIEGGEYDLFSAVPAASLASVENVVLEWHRVADYEQLRQGLAQQLTGAGFTVEWAPDDILRASR